MSKRRRFSGDLKAKIALEALRGDRTLQEIASKRQVHPNQVSTWKRQAIDGLGEVFSNGGERRRRDHESEIRDLVSRVRSMSRAERRTMVIRAHPALARHGTPEIFNTDQGGQFTGFAFTGRLREVGIRISMDGRGRYLDNIFIERLWRSLKYEAVYLRELADGFEARRVIGEWIDFYNTERPHSALGGKTPATAYRGAPPVDMMDKPLRALPTSPQAQQQRQGDRCKGILAA